MFSKIGFLTGALAGLLAGPLAPTGSRVALTDELAAALSTYGHGGGRIGRLWQDWIMRPLESIDKETMRDLRRARRASRELVGTWGPTARWVHLAEEQIVGASGLRLRVQLKRREGEKLVPDLERNRRVEQAWKRWSHPSQCDVAGRWSLATHERVLAKTWARDGEGLLRMVEGFDNRFGFALQALDPDQLDDRWNLPAGVDQNEVRQGVEIDEWGRPVAFWCFTAHPSDVGRRPRRERIPAEQILHWFEPTRASQYRGLPRLLATLIAAKMTAGYEEAELTSTRSNAIRMGFYERNPETAAIPAPGTPAADAEDKIFWEAEPGQFGLLPVGWKVSSWAPTSPNNQYGPFVKSMIRTIASGLGTAYNTLANDLENVNFSSLRSGTLLERDRWKVDQQELINACHLRLFPRWLLWAVTMGELPPADLEAADADSFSFQPRGWPWVDPLKDVQTDILAIRAGLWSRSRAAAARGVDLEDLFQELAAEKELAESLGLGLETDLAGRPIDDSTDEGVKP